MYNYRKFCSAPVVSESNKTSGNGGYGGLSRGRSKHVVEAYRTNSKCHQSQAPASRAGSVSTDATKY